MAKILNTDQVIALNKKAIRSKYNRTLESVVDTLDPEGRHVVFSSMLMGPDDGIVRAWIMVKVKNKDNPVTLFLDISLKDYNQLPNEDEPTSG